MAQEERPDGASPGEPEYEFWKAAAEAEKNHYTKQEIADAAFDVAFTLDREAK